MNLGVLLGPKIDLPRLATVLDELGHLGRVDTIRGWDKRTQAALFEAAKGFRKISLGDYVPPGTEPLVEVIHHGKNTLPAFTHFQKRFCKPEEGGDAELWGYNHQTTSWATGPGYYVAHAGEAEGEVDIDYRKVPSAKPAAWPEIRDNTKGMGALVYGGMVDVLRGISSHVSIGRAKKKGAYMDAWFVLCREPPA